MEHASEQPVVSYQHDLENPGSIAEKSFSRDASSEKQHPNHVEPTIAPTGHMARWKKFWNAAVREGRWPRVVYITFGIILGVIWITLTVYLAGGELEYAEARGDRIKNNIQNDQLSNLGVVLQGALKKYDQSTRALTISWSGLYASLDENNKTVMTPLNEANDGGITPVELRIYRDVSTTIVKYNDTNSDPKYNWMYTVDNATEPHIATIGRHAWDSFNTDIDFQGLEDNKAMWKQPAFGYPLDELHGSIVFVASYNDTFYNISKEVFPISDATLVDNSLNWRFDISAQSNCSATSDDIVNNVTALGYDFTSVTNQELAEHMFPCYLKIELTATRPPLVRFAAVMAVIVNWTSTMFIFILTCEVLLLRRGWMLSGTDLLGVTFTALFALPTVRSLLPGAPEFGCLIDLIGIIPNVLLISLCITAIAVTKLNREKHDEGKGKSD